MSNCSYVIPNKEATAMAEEEKKKAAADAQEI